MLLVFFYITAISFSWLFYRLFSLGYTDILFYILLPIVLVLAYVVAFAAQIGWMKLYYEMRKRKEPKNKANHRYANRLLNLTRHLLRVKIIVSGKEYIPNGNFVFVGNHQENYDIIMVKPIFKDMPMNFIAKESLFKVPILGNWMELLGNIPISPYADRSAAESIVKGIKTVKSGMPMAIFPEGKRSFSNEMVEFKPGAFKLAMKSKADILIGTLYNFSNVLKGYPLKRQVVHIAFQKVIKYDEYKELSSIELAVEVKSRIQAQLDKFDQELN